MSRAVVITCSTRAATGVYPDRGGPLVVEALRQWGFEVGEPIVVPDGPEVGAALVGALATGPDLVVTTGGISAGDHDVVKAVLRDEPGFWFGKVAQRPGRPQGFGVLDVDGRAVPVLTLPGTPVAAYGAFLLYGRDALAVLAGDPAGAPVRRVRLGAPVHAGDRTVLLPGVYDDNGHVVPLPGHAGHSQRLLARAEMLLVVPPLGRTLEAEAIEVLDL